MRTPKKFALLGTLLAMSGGLAAAHAAQRVTLRGGSELVCDHQKNLNGQVRLYLTKSEENYLDVAANQIVAVESVPQEPVAKQPASSPATVAPAAAAPATIEQPVDVTALLQQVGAKHHLDPDLLASVIHAESNGQVRAVSPVGARGLMQLMPATAADLGVRDSLAADQNIAGGTTYLDALLMYYHENIALALAAYNAGPAAVDRYHGIPPYTETRRYVARVIHDFNQRKLREAKHRSLQASWSSMAAIASVPAR